MAKHKVQHYLAQSYLKEFSPGSIGGKPQIWIYKKDKNEIKLSSVKKTAYSNYYYSYKKKDGTFDHSIEENFSKIEKDYPFFLEIIKKNITATYRGEELNNLPIHYHHFICAYVFLNYIRVPKTMTWILEKSEKHHIRMKELGLLEYSETDTHNTTIRTLEYLLNSTYDKAVKALLKKNVNVEFPIRHNAAIITCDNPFIRFNTTGKNGLIYQNTQVIFPLSKRAFIKFNGFGNEIKFIKHHDISIIDDLNKAIIKNAINEVYCNDPEIVYKLLLNENKHVDIKRPKNVNITKD